MASSFDGIGKVNKKLLIFVSIIAATGKDILAASLLTI
jgi:hypothetical protein